MLLQVEKNGAGKRNAESGGNSPIDKHGSLQLYGAKYTQRPGTPGNWLDSVRPEIVQAIGSKHQL